MKIEASELRARQRAFAAKLGSAGYQGAVVVSRGGGTFDRCADVLYLTGHYQTYPYLPSHPPFWSGRAHCVVIVCQDGRTVLCTSTDEIEDHVVADEVRHSGDFIQTVIGALQDLGLVDQVLGLVGGDVLPWELGVAFTSAAPGLRWAVADELLAQLRRRKSMAELDAVRSSAEVGREAMTAFLGAVRVGVRECDAVSAAVQIAVGAGAGLYYVTCSSGPTIGSFTSRSLPGYSTRSLENGDLVRIDLVTVLDGYLCDFGRTVVVGPPSADQTRLIDAMHSGLDAVIDAVRPGVVVSDLVLAGDARLADLDVAMSVAARPGQLQAAYPPHWGHGLGLGWERPWLIADEQMRLEPGMVLAVERAIELAGVGTALAEQNLLVTENGAELLTGGPEGIWT